MKFSEKFRMQAAALSSLHPFTIFDVGNSAERREGGRDRRDARDGISTWFVSGGLWHGSGPAIGFDIVQG